MTTNTEITLYHFDDTSEEYTVSHHFASLHKTVKSVPTENGFRYSDTYKIRIPTLSEIAIDTGDYIRFGTFPDSRPDKAACVKVMAFSDNRRGLNPHWRIEAV